MSRPPVEITDSLRRFQEDFPDSNKLAFIMMKFGDSKAHEQIESGIRTALGRHTLWSLFVPTTGSIHTDDLWFNILTYIYGTRFGIAVFEQLDADVINPNVSLEVGYMLALGKKVCFLKDSTNANFKPT